MGAPALRGRAVGESSAYVGVGLVERAARLRVHDTSGPHGNDRLVVVTRERLAEERLSHTIRG